MTRDQKKKRPRVKPPTVKLKSCRQVNTYDEIGKQVGDKYNPDELRFITSVRTPILTLVVPFREGSTSNVKYKSIISVLINKTLPLYTVLLSFYPLYYL